jgi:fatty-acyl-CoA synthase
MEKGQATAKKLISRLQKSGLEKGDQIGILSHNCFEFGLLYAGAAKLGAIMLPIN